MKIRNVAITVVSVAGAVVLSYQAFHVRGTIDLTALGALLGFIGVFATIGFISNN